MTHSAVHLQLEITVRAPRSVEPTRDLLDEWVKRWADDNVLPPGVQIAVIDWTRPNGHTTTADGYSQDELRHRFARLLLRGSFTVRLRRYRGAGPEGR